MSDTSNLTHGTKNTTDPASKEHPKIEHPGAVLSDSLAASSDTFAEKNPGYDGPAGVSSENATSANTDTSGATTLEPAPDRPRRDTGLKETAKYAEGVGGQPKFPGVYDNHGYVGGPSWDRKHSNGNAEGETGHKHGNKEKEGSVVGTAPTYVAVDVLREGQVFKPKGKNLKEVEEFEGEKEGKIKNASFEEEIGEENDPAIRAINRFERITQESALDVGGAGRQKGVTGESIPYNVLPVEGVDDKEEGA